MNKKHISIPVQYSISKTFSSDETKIPVEILVMHDKVNLNTSNFELEVIELAKESIKNIPILGYIRKVDGSDAKDFAGHEMEIVFRDGEIKCIYLERPIGCIPETNNYEYVEKDGKTYVKVMGYLWKDYLNEGYEVLQENSNKSVSMEITVDDYEVKNGMVNVLAYRYIGITVLGDNVPPAMEGANMQVIQFSQNFSQEFYERVEKLNNELKQFTQEGGNEDMAKGKKKEFSESVNTVVVEEMSKDEDKGKCDNTEPVLFSATYRQRREALVNALDGNVVRDENGVCIEETYYYVEDFTDQYVYVEKSHWTVDNYECTYGRFTYTLDESAMVVSITSDFEQMIKVWLTIEENAKIEADRTALENQVTEYTSKISEKDAIIAELEAYKNNSELEKKQVVVDEVLVEFETVLGKTEEFRSIKENAINMDVEVLEKELFALVGKITHKVSNKGKKSNFSKIVVNTETVEPKTKNVYGEAEKYFNK